MNKAACSILFALILSPFALSNPHPFLLQAAQDGRWRDFKAFLLENPHEEEELDDSIFKLIHRANRYDVLDRRPIPSAPPLEDPRKPAPSAPPLEKADEVEMEDSFLARALQEQEFDDSSRYEVLRSPSPQNRICNLANVAACVAVGIGAYLVWNNLDFTRVIDF